MIKSIPITAIALLMVCPMFTSCSVAEGNRQERNLKKSLIARLDTLPGVEYVGRFDTEWFKQNGMTLCRSGVVYYVTDSVGNRVERNARVVTNDDCTKILAWEDLDSKILGTVKSEVSEKFENDGVSVDGDLIDALLKSRQ